MKKKLFDSEGPVFSVLEQIGQLIMLSVLWLLCCIPIVTIFASTAAMYDAIMRTVRGPEGNTLGVFWKAFRKYLGRGTALTLILVGTFAVLEMASIYLLGTAYPSGVILVAMILNAFVATFAAAVLVRFDRGVIDTWKLSFVLSVQFAHNTLLLLAGAAVIGILLLYLFPILLVLIFPGAWSWCGSFLLEKAMRKYTGGDDEVDWKNGK